MPRLRVFYNTSKDFFSIFAYNFAMFIFWQKCGNGSDLTGIFSGKTTLYTDMYRTFCQDDIISQLAKQLLGNNRHE